MPTSFFTDTLNDEKALHLALELSKMGFTDPMTVSEPDNTAELSLSMVNPLVNVNVALEDLRNGNPKKSQNMTECVPVPSSEHVAEIVGRQGCKIKALRAKTNTYIKTPVRGEEPVFVVTGRKEDVGKAKREILSAAEHFSQIRASRKNNLAGLGSGASTPPGPPANIPGHVTIQVRVPYRVVGLVVGPKGATIKRIQHQTHTYIVTPSRDKEPIFEVTGLPDSVEGAKREIEAHIAMRTGNGTSMNGLGGLGDFDDSAIFTTLYNKGLNSLFTHFEPAESYHQLPSSISSSGPFSSTGSISSSSSSSGTSGRGDLGAIWTSGEREEAVASGGESPGFDPTNTISNIWSYPTASAVGQTARPSPPSSTSPIDHMLSASHKCVACCESGKGSHAPCGVHFFCSECVTKVVDNSDGQCPLCVFAVRNAGRMFSSNP